VVLEVEDEALGFKTMDKPGLGLISIKERPKLLNGTVGFLDRRGVGPWFV
jgi:signal transduction histidine kinase